MNWLITGANRGIGLGLVKGLLARGENVVATARNPDDSPLAELAAEGVTVITLDVADEASVRAAAEEASRRVRHLDVLVNNAGIGGPHDTFPDIDLDEVRRIFEVDAVGPLRVARAFHPLMLKGQTRKLVFLTSKMGSIADNRSGGSYGYRMAKAALNMATKSLAVDLAGDGFKTLAVHPGWVKTDMGGPRAIHDLEDSVNGILRLVDALDEGLSGEMWGAMEQRIPW